jgi:hypothetical protein
LHSILYTPNWRGRKIKESDGIGWNVFHCVPLHSIEFLNIQTMEHHFIPLHSIPSYSINPNIAFGSITVSNAK